MVHKETVCMHNVLIINFNVDINTFVEDAPHSFLL